MGCQGGGLPTCSGAGEALEVMAAALGVKGVPYCGQKQARLADEQVPVLSPMQKCVVAHWQPSTCTCGRLGRLWDKAAPWRLVGAQTLPQRPQLEGLSFPLSPCCPQRPPSLPSKSHGARPPPLHQLSSLLGIFQGR